MTHFKVGSGEILIQGEKRDDGAHILKIYAVLDGPGVIGARVADAKIGPVICTMEFTSYAHAVAVYKALRCKPDPVTHYVWKIVENTL